MAQKHIYVLGINAYDHDVSACLLRDGEIAFAVEKERITRQKHATGFFQEVVDYVLAAEGITLDDVDLVVRNCYVFPVEELETRMVSQDVPEVLSDKERQQAEKHPLYLNKSNKLVTLSHHLAHAYSAFACCPFEEGAVMVVDGVGNYCADIKEPGQRTEGANPLARESESYYKFSGSKLETLKKVWLNPVRGFLSDEFYSMRGLGAVYSRVSSYMFADWNKCGEVMGLAPYGTPNAFRPLVEIEKDGELTIPDWDVAFNKPWLVDREKKWDASPKMQHWKDLAWRVQDDTEKVLLERARWLRETTGAKNLVLSGGVALNCVANGRLVREAGFEKVWIQPAAGDNGISIGCALYGHLEILKQPRKYVMRHAYLGRPYTDEEVRAPVEKRLVKLQTVVRHSDDICRESAKLLAEGHVFGWFQDRSEFGPRALGNRSILADPRKPEIKDKLNSRVKFRQAFRPLRADRPRRARARNLRGRRRVALHAARQERGAGLARPGRRHRACRRHRARADRARRHQSEALPAAEGIRGAHRRAGADQHVLQRQGRADRGDAGRRGELLHEHRHRLSRAARHADLEEPLAPHADAVPRDRLADVGDREVGPRGRRGDPRQAGLSQAGLSRGTHSVTDDPATLPGRAFSSLSRVEPLPRRDWRRRNEARTLMVLRSSGGHRP